MPRSSKAKGSEEQSQGEARKNRPSLACHLLSSFAHHSNAYHEEISLPLSSLLVPANALRKAKAPGPGQRRRERQGPAKAKAKPNRPQAVGPAIGANVATPVSNIKTLKDFKVELHLFSVPGGEQGSWVNLTHR
jgi:hypothetical protein